MDDQLSAAAIGWRRHLHARPELSLRESDTAVFVRDRLAELGIDCETGIGGHGVVATMRRPGGAGRSVGLRADMDALPIAEATGLPYASTRPGVMHACGHDGHTASLLAAAALLQQDESWAGTIRLVFQPAEEGFGGAEAMLADGLLERFPMDRIFGYHNWPGLEAGTVAVHDGPAMASIGHVEIRLDGHAAHGAMPHQGRDPVLGVAQLLMALQGVVSRELDPLDPGVLSICVLRAGEADNQIPASAHMQGTYRAFDPAVRDRLETGIRRVAEGVAAASGLRATVTLRRGAPSTINAPAEAELAAAAAAASGAPIRRDLAPTTASEDFGCYLQRLPGCFAWIGNGPAAAGAGLHNPGYDFNDAILPVAANWLATVARQALRG